MTQVLPRSWTSASLNILGTWLGGGTPSKANLAYWHNGTVHWVSPKDMKRLLIDSAQDQITKKAVKESATNLVPANSVLMVTRSGILAHTFPVGINTVDVAINQDLKAWTSLGAVDPTYAAYFLKASGQQILRDCSKDGTTVSSIDFDRLSAYPVSIAPANEQRRIVSKIDELFSRIDEGEQALNRVEKLVERYRQSVLKAAVTGELSRDWREARKRAGESVESGEALLARIRKGRRAAWETAELAKLKAKGKAPTDDRWKQQYIEPQPPDTTGLPQLPEGWVWTSLAQLKSFSLYGPRFSSDDYVDDGYSVLRTSDISEAGRVNLATTPKLALSAEEFAKYKVDKGDLLITRTGSLGTLALFDDDVDAIPGAYLIQFRIPAPDVTRWWLFHFFRSPLGQQQLLDGGAGVGRPNLNAPHIESIPIPLAPQYEQVEILDRIDVAISLTEQRRDDFARATRECSAIRQSILKAAFSGQLVPQDPSDEPAAKLLERIAAGRAAATAAAPRKRKKKTA